MNRRLLGFLLCCVIFTTQVFAQENAQEEDSWAKYAPGKLSDVAKANTSPGMQELGGVTLAMGSHPVKARVIYTGKSRPIPEDKLSLLELWMQSNRLTKEHFLMFTEEFLFIEDSAEHWLPVQGVLIPHFRKEMQEGGSVDLFARWIGITFAEPGKRQHVFIVNEFEKVDG